MASHNGFLSQPGTYGNQNLIDPEGLAAVSRKFQ
jgi:hypothetical protein